MFEETFAVLGAFQRLDGNFMAFDEAPVDQVFGLSYVRMVGHDLDSSVRVYD